MIVAYNSNEGLFLPFFQHSLKPGIIHEHFIPWQMDLFPDSYEAKEICNKLKASYPGHELRDTVLVSIYMYLKKATFRNALANFMIIILIYR